MTPEEKEQLRLQQEKEAQAKAAAVVAERKETRAGGQLTGGAAGRGLGGSGSARRLDGAESSIKQSARNFSSGNQNTSSVIPDSILQSNTQGGFDPPAGPAFDSVTDGPDFDSTTPERPDVVDPTAGQAFDPPAGPAFDSVTDGPDFTSDAVSNTVLDFAGNITSQPTDEEEDEEDEFGFFSRNLA